MAEKLDPKQVVTFEELLQATMMYEAKAGGSRAQLRAQSRAQWGTEGLLWSSENGGQVCGSVREKAGGGAGTRTRE